MNYLQHNITYIPLNFLHFSKKSVIDNGLHIKAINSRLFTKFTLPT